MRTHPDIRELKIYNAAARRRDDASSKQRIFLQKTITINNLWSQDCSQLPSHSQYNVQVLSILSRLLSYAKTCYDGEVLLKSILQQTPHGCSEQSYLQVTKTSFKRLLQ